MLIEEGSVVDGIVTGLTNFGAFVKLPTEETGMVHISEISQTYITDIKEHLAEGQEVKVRVLGVNEQGKISLSIKQALPPEKKPPRKGGSRRNNVWKGQKQDTGNGEMSFEDMMASFKKVSDEKMTDLKRASDSKHSGRKR